MNQDELCQNGMGNRTGFTKEEPIAMSDGLTATPGTLDELGEKLKSSLCAPRACPKCAFMIPSEIEAKVRVNNQREEITVAVSLEGVLAPLKAAGAKYEVKVHPSGSILFIKMKRGE